MKRKFHPCRLSPATCGELRQARDFKFHDWTLALSFAIRRAVGRRQRHRVIFDGAHWRVEDAR